MHSTQQILVNLLPVFRVDWWCGFNFRIQICIRFLSFWNRAPSWFLWQKLWRIYRWKQCFGSVFLLYGSGYGSSILGWIPIRILIQSGSRVLMTRNWKKYQLKKLYFLNKYVGNFCMNNKKIKFFSLGLQKGRPSYRRSLQPSKENIQNFITSYEYRSNNPEPDLQHTSYLPYIQLFLQKFPTHLFNTIINSFCLFVYLNKSCTHYPNVHCTLYETPLCEPMIKSRVR